MYRKIKDTKTGGVAPVFVSLKKNFLHQLKPNVFCAIL